MEPSGRSTEDLIGRLRAGLAGRYAVERELGHGGMAIVFLARDIRHSRQVAIKVLHPDLAHSLGAERFLLEIRTTAQIVHPHVLPLHDSGEVDGLLYYIMPYVAGESLADRLERDGKLPVLEAVRIAREVADGLAHAHALNVVHRDIKPGNILLSAAGSRASIADFGLARALHEAANTRLTATGISVGSPLYMSPEQIAGARVIDGRSDVYGLGCMLFEMIAGRPPFGGSSLQEVLRQHLLEAPPSLRETGADVTDELDEAARGAMAKEPADRPTAAELHRRLAQAERVLAGEADAGPRAGSRPGHRGSRWLPLRSAIRRARRRDRVTVAGVAMLLLVALGWGSWRWAGTRQAARVEAAAAADLAPAKIAVLYFDDHSPAEELGYLASGLTEGLIQELGQVEALNVVSLNGVKPFRGESVSPDSIGRALEVGSIVEGSVTRSGGRIRVNVQLVDAKSSTVLDRGTVEARLGDVFALQDSLVDAVGESLRRALGREIRLRQTRRGTENARAWELMQRTQEMRDDFLTVRLTDADAARRILGRADTAAAQAAALDPTWSHPLVSRGWLARDRALLDGPIPGRYDREWGDSALSRAERAVALRPENAAAHELRGVVRRDYARGLDAAAASRLFADAETDLRRAVALDDQRARAWWALSELLLARTEFAEAKRAAERAVRADAFLENAAGVLHQIYYSAAQLGPVDDAVRPCNEGRRRFPEDSRFIECQLFILASFPSAPADVTRARVLADSLANSVAVKNRGRFRSLGTMLAAQVAARAGLRDTAVSLIEAARGDTVIPWLAYYEAHARLQLGDQDQAVALLTRYLDFDPDTAYIARDWWFSDLRSHPAFRRLVGQRQVPGAK